jgi:hypothetical protein
MLKRIAGHAYQGAADFAVQSNLRRPNEVNNDAAAVGAIFNFEFCTDGYGAVAERAGFD